MFHTKLGPMLADVTGWQSLSIALTAALTVAPADWSPAIGGALTITTFVSFLLKGSAPPPPTGGNT